MLLRLVENGLKDVRGASGFARGIITDSKPCDIDIQYYGGVSQKMSQQLLIDVVNEQGVTDLEWDYGSIWDVSGYPGITRTTDYI